MSSTLGKSLRRDRNETFTLISSYLYGLTYRTSFIGHSKLKSTHKHPWPNIVFHTKTKPHQKNRYQTTVF